MHSSTEVLMAEIERLSIALPAPMADAIRRAVKAGEYASTSEVIRDALRLWESRRHLRERDVEVLRQRWDEGKASGRQGVDKPGLEGGTTVAGRSCERNCRFQDLRLHPFLTWTALQARYSIDWL